jgi:hypothetical protein
MATHHALVRLGVELALAVNDYNSGITETLDEVTKLTLAYLEKVKEALQEKVIDETQVNDYFALVGQTWGSVQARFKNEFVVGSESESSA